MPFMRAAVRLGVRQIREISPSFQATIKRGRGPFAVFLPVEHRKGAALLRCYGVAQGLAELGWQTLVLSPKLTLAQRQRLLRRANPDLIVMQGARHPLNRPEYYADWPIVYDMDDADFHLSHLADPVREAMPQVTAVLAGSRYIADWCESAGAASTHVVWTGTPVSASRRPPHRLRAPVVAWAQTRPMTYVDEADWVRGVMRDLAKRRPGIVLRLFDRTPGDDPGFADSFKTDGLKVEWAPAQKYSDYLGQFDDVALGLAPLSPAAPFSRGKSFGKILSYLDRHVPIIATDIGEYPSFFTPETAVLSHNKDTWCEEANRLLNDPKARQQMSDAAFEAFQTRLTLPAIANHLDRLLRGVLGSVRPN